MPKTTPKITSRNTFQVLGVRVQCLVLEDGRRVISSDSLVKLLDAMARGIPDMDLESHDLDHFVMWCRTIN